MQKVLEISQKNFDSAFTLNLPQVNKHTMEKQSPMRWDGFMSNCPPTGAINEKCNVKKLPSTYKYCNTVPLRHE